MPGSTSPRGRAGSRRTPSRRGSPPRSPCTAHSSSPLPPWHRSWPESPTTKRFRLPRATDRDEQEGPPMGFMDKVKETANKGTEMAKGAAKAGQEKLDEQKTKKKIADLKEELGGVVYAQKTGSNGSADAEIERLVNEIKDAESELESIGAASADAT